MTSHATGAGEPGEPFRARRVEIAPLVAGVAEIAGAMALIAAYFLPWSSTDTPWYPIQIYAGAGDTATNIATEVALFFPVVAAAVTGLLALTSRRWAWAPLAGLSVFLGSFSLLVCLVLLGASHSLEPSSANPPNVGATLATLACAVITLAGIALLVSEPALPAEAEQ